LSREGGSQSEGDRFLLRRIQSGDEEAFRQLVERYTGRLSAYARRKLGRESPDAEDAVQDTFLGLLENLGRLPDVRSLEAYLFTILRNKLIDIVRRSPKAHGVVSRPLGPTDDSRAGFDPPARDVTPSHHARVQEAGEMRRKVLADILGEALGTLKAEKNFRDLKILELLFFAGLKGKDAAALVGTSEPTVTRTKAEAIERLGRLARRHPQFDPSLGVFESGEDPTSLLSDLWRENLLSCLKRSTLGSYALGVLGPEWKDYAAFHLETIRCEACAANLEDIRAGEGPSKPLKERVFASSVGFVRKKK